MPDVVLFDLDETLILEKESVAAALRAACERVLEGRADASGAAESVRRRARELWHASPLGPWCRAIGISSWEGLWGAFAGEGPELAALRAWVPAYRAEAWSRGLAEHGVVDRSAAAAASAAFLEERALRHTPYPEAAAALAAVAPGRRLALVTNGASDVQREKLARSGLAPWFEVVAVSGEVGHGKPDPRVFRWVLEALGAGPERAVMVGNDLDRDVGGARAAGVRAVWVDREGTGSQGGVVPDVTIRSLAELPALLA